MAIDNSFEEISPDTSFNYNKNLKGESRDLDLILNFEESYQEINNSEGENLSQDDSAQIKLDITKI
ncbi:23294_t:CDS:2 [Gigaspora margarita]|uniref:23294_t:CDS:1 n=1 Tax=Gigaspora margarita TaxID=4874 RepID=A0ABM8W075_GIGMA|nr:23294_t:CDS:2 [Gigaspora margarita]